jgi:hypothetical protein
MMSCRIGSIAIHLLVIAERKAQPPLKQRSKILKGYFVINRAGVERG